MLTELPYDFSQLLKKFDTKNVTLGHNRWMCSCHAEITGRGLQRKIQDQQEVPFLLFAFKLCQYNVLKANIRIFKYPWPVKNILQVQYVTST